MYCVNYCKNIIKREIKTTNNSVSYTFFNVINLTVIEINLSLIIANQKSFFTPVFPLWTGR